MSRKPARLNVTVAADEEHQGKANLAKLAKNLEKAGFKTSKIHHSIGLISGDVTRAKRRRLELIKGVRAVEEETHFQLAPPDAAIQ